MSTNPKQIFSPQDHPELLKGWVLHAHKMRDRHDLAARTFEMYHGLLGISATFLSAAVGTSVFASLRSRLSPEWAIGLGVIAMAAAGLTALQSSLRFEERAEKHRASGARFKVIIREFEQLFAHASSPANVPERFLADLKARLDALEVEAPVVPQGIYDRVQREYSSGAVKFCSTVAQLTGTNQKHHSGSGKQNSGSGQNVE